MPHPRKRLALARLAKKLGFSPVVAIQGARQTGKSYLAREFIRESHPRAKYLSLDLLSLRQSAERSPQTFLAEHAEALPLIIDEAQKAPDLFDAIKFEVDQQRIPGRFLLLGSTEFSRLSRIRESLTGRMSRIRLYPLTLAESIGLELAEKSWPPTRKQILQYLALGGMPGIFAVRDADERTERFKDWVDLTCQRDIHQFAKLKLDSDLASAILSETCTLEEPTQAGIARRLKTDPRRIASHLKALTELYVLQKLLPHPSGTGKPIYLPLDTGIATHLGAPLSRRLQIWVMNERMAKASYYPGKSRKFYYYRSTGKKFIHLVEEVVDSPLRAFQVFENERILKTDALLMKGFLQKNPGSQCVVLAPIQEPQKVEGIAFLPWEALVRKARNR
jgi:predicted AAA+ superfamily ATPase